VTAGGSGSTGFGSARVFGFGPDATHRSCGRESRRRRPAAVTSSSLSKGHLYRFRERPRDSVRPRSRGDFEGTPVRRGIHARRQGRVHRVEQRGSCSSGHRYWLAPRRFQTPPVIFGSTQANRAGPVRIRLLAHHLRPGRGRSGRRCRSAHVPCRLPPGTVIAGGLGRSDSRWRGPSGPTVRRRSRRGTLRSPTPIPTARSGL